MIITPIWGQVIEDYLAMQRAAGLSPGTVATRKQHLQHLARRIGADPGGVTADQLVSWASVQRWAPSTRHGRRTTFRGFFRWCKRTGRTATNPAKRLPKVKAPQGAPRPTPDRVYHEALMRADHDETTWLQLAADHGLRRAEIAVIHSDDLIEDLVGWSLLVHGKGAKDRVVPLTLTMARRLRDAEPGWLVIGDHDGHVSPRWLGKRINRLMTGRWTVHSLRHRFAGRTYRAGDLLTTQELLGHASPATTRMYVEPDRSAMRAAVLAAAS